MIARRAILFRGLVHVRRSVEFHLTDWFDE
jgi:hypothetical protein